MMGESSTQTPTSELSEESDPDEVTDSDIPDMMGESSPEGMMEQPSESTEGQADSDSDMSSDDSALLDQLRNSPFGPLLDIDGVDGVEDIFGNVGGAGGGNGSFGGGGVGSGNPFANWDPLTDSNPFGEGDEPTTSTETPEGSSNPFGTETSSGSSNPFGQTETSSGSSNPFGETEAPEGSSNPVSQIDSLTGEIGFNIDNFVDSMEARIEGLIDSVPQDFNEPGTVADIGPSYIVRDGEGGFYLSANESVDNDDMLIFGGAIGNQSEAESVEDYIDFMAGGSDQPGVVAAIGDEYLIEDGDGGWYVSADETFDSNDMQLLNGSSILNLPDFEGFNGL